MSIKKKIAKMTGIRESMIPAGYQILGNILLLKFTKISLEKKEKIATALMKMLPYVKTVCEIKEVKGELREPVINVIVGNGTVTTHKENDVLYKIDASKIMFSKGNLYERKRLLGQVKEGESVVDMFAGIGYFSMPIAKFTKAKEIIAIEKNPTSYNFLTENIQLNKISNVIALQGDCKIAARTMKEKADRVLMGYFPNTEEFLPSAIWMAKSGCVIHFHNVYKESDLWSKPIETIQLICEKFQRSYEIMAKKKVKSYGPRKWHVVIDFKVK
ncbi:MAG TPA: class I SAM-dependent methyltransferase family protein [archaeon]|nr:class I SAM-dependent methyltransferase family protein [archaeon]